MNSLTEWDWDDLRVVLAAARAGSLSRAAAELGTTQPTVGRRIDAFELAVGGPVLVRDARGCRPTPLGERLLPHLEAMAAAAGRAGQVVQTQRDAVRGVVRVACGPLIGRLLARHVDALLEGAPDLEVEIAPSLAFTNLEGGQADIALRSRRPDKAHLVGRKLRDSPFAIYGGHRYVEANPAAQTAERFTACRWVGYVDGVDTPSDRWLRAQLGRSAAVRFSDAPTILEAAAANAGLCVLPMHAGEDDARLQRVSDPLSEALSFESWLVAHASSRNQPHVRWVIDRLVELMARWAPA
ncbi:MAG: LysR family transcriptional regulator [Myxococcales bacterium]|nr:LysR family transcriptional regulator [Myxococcales bacterium]